MSEVRKYQVKASDRPNKHEVRTGQALNAVATAGGLHAAYLTGKEITRAVRNGPEVGRHAKPVKVTRMRRAAGKVPGAGRVLRDPRKAALAGLGAWGVLHTGELVGDAISARALHRQSKIAKEAAVIEQSIVKSYTGAGESGTGRNLELVSKKRPKCPNCELPCDKDGKCPMCGKDCRHEKGESKADEQREHMGKAEKKPKKNKYRGRAVLPAVAPGQHYQGDTGEPEFIMVRRGETRFRKRPRYEVTAHLPQYKGPVQVMPSWVNRKSGDAMAANWQSGKRVKVKINGQDTWVTYGKSVRRFDSEADRQRRMGLYAGGAAGLAAVAGNEARREFTLVRGDQVRRPNGTLTSKRPVKGVRLRPENKSMKIKAGSGRKAAVLAAIAAAGMATGVGSYKRGISRRNQPWT